MRAFSLPGPSRSAVQFTLLVQVEGLDFIQLVADSAFLDQFKQVVKGPTVLFAPMKHIEPCHAVFASADAGAVLGLCTPLAGALIAATARADRRAEASP